MERVDLVFTVYTQGMFTGEREREREGDRGDAIALLCCFENVDVQLRFLKSSFPHNLPLLR